MARRFGADWIVNASQENPREAISEITSGRTANVVMDVSGNPSGAELALSVAGGRVTIVLPGIYKGKRASLNLDRAVFQKIRIIGVFSHDFRAVRPAIKIAHQPRYPFEELMTHRLRLDEAEQALRMVAGEGEKVPLKVVLDQRRVTICSFISSSNQNSIVSRVHSSLFVERPN